MYDVKGLYVSYQIDSNSVTVINNLDFVVKPGEFVAIQGPSGSGKSTLFYILGFLLKPSAGNLIFDGINVTNLSADELAVIRNQKIGFIFQQFHLLTKATALENILLPTRYPSELAHDQDLNIQKAKLLAEQLGLDQHLHHFPNQLSGGQQQRVAIARALMNDIDLILADEPTGNLDSQNAKQTLDLLEELNQKGKTIVLITHDAEVAKRCSKVYHFKDGSFTHVVENFKMQVSSPVPLLKNKNEFFVLPPFLTLYRKLIKSVLPMALENIFRNKVKSLLTMLGVVIGVAAVLAMVTIGQFTRKKILETYETLGVNTLLLTGRSNWRLKATDQVAVKFTSFQWQQDFHKIKNIFPQIKSLSPNLNDPGYLVNAGGIEVGDNKVTVLGVTPEYLGITNRALNQGRNLSSFDIENQSSVCVVGQEIAQRLFGNRSALGQIITASNGNSNIPCRVIGVLALLTSNSDSSPPNLQVMMPYTYFQHFYLFGTRIHSVILQTYPNTEVEIVGKEIKSYFLQKYGRSGNFTIDSDSTLISQMKKFLNIFSLLLGAISTLSLLVGGIGINNMMLVSVTERLKEFGIRKALGATNRSIRLQVLTESVVLCFIAGVIGVILGFSAYETLIFFATKLVPHLKFEWLIDPYAVLLSLFSIVAVGIGSGLIPALKAEKLQVIEALRSE